MSDEYEIERVPKPKRKAPPPSDAQVTQRLLMVLGRRIAARKKKMQRFRKVTRGGG